MIQEIRHIEVQRPLVGSAWVWRDTVTGERGRARIDLDGLAPGDELLVELTCDCGWTATRFLDVPPHLLSFDGLFAGDAGPGDGDVPHTVTSWTPPSVGEIRVTEVFIDARSAAHRDNGRRSKARPGVITWADDDTEQAGIRLIFGTNSAVRREGIGRRLQDWRDAGLRKPGFIAGAEIIRAYADLSERKGSLSARDRRLLAG